MMPQGQENSDDCQCNTDGRMKTAYQYADISVPIELEPHVEVGNVDTECCGEPDVACIRNECGNICEVVITQKVCVKIPLRFCVTACERESSISCGADNDDTL